MKIFKKVLVIVFWLLVAILTFGCMIILVDIQLGLICYNIAFPSLTVMLTLECFINYLVEV